MDVRPIIYDVKPGQELVHLQPAQVKIAMEEGMKRFKVAWKFRETRGLKDVIPSRKRNMHLSGAMAELAVSVALGLEWTAPSNKFGPDVGGKVEVRSTAHQSGTLMISDGDIARHPQTPYVLVTLDLDQKSQWNDIQSDGSVIAVLRGWVLSNDAVYKGNYGTPDPSRPPVWMVPQHRLQPIPTLKDWLKKRRGVRWAS